MKWEAKVVKHKGESRIAVYFDKDKTLIARIKLLEGVRWSASMGAWHLPDTSAYRVQFKLTPSVLLHPNHEQSISTFKQWLYSKRYSENTIKTYTEALKSFLLFFNTKSVIDITELDVIDYNNNHILKNKLSSSYQNQIVNAIKLFFSTVAGRKIEPTLIHRPKREKTLPNVLSKEEVKMILDAIANIKHKAMLSLIYSCGLRRSELLHLRADDIDSKRGIVIIRQSKGKKDRIVPLSPKILELLRAYYKGFKPTVWLFEGQKVGEQYDERSLSNVLKQGKSYSQWYDDRNTTY
jgi:integrase/recombinase XerD